MNGDIPWRPLLPEEGLEGLKRTGSATWTRTAPDTVEGQGTGALGFGADDWRDYELDVYVTPLAGGNVQIPFRVAPDAKRLYVLDLLLGWKAVAISKIDNGPGGAGLQKISVVDQDLVHGREYHVRLAARDRSLTSYVDGRLVNQVTDHDCRSGPLGFSLWQSRTRFRNPRYRLLA